MTRPRSIYDVDGALVGFVHPHGSGWRALDRAEKPIGTFPIQTDAVRAAIDAARDPDRHDARLLHAITTSLLGQGGGA